MSVESVDFIDDLVITNPVSSTDLVRYGANHLRNFKNGVRNSFAGTGGAILCAGADVGTVNAIIITPTPPLLEYTTRMLIVWHQSITNTSTTPTINISGLGAKTIVSVSGAALAAGDLVANRVYVGVYDGTSVRLISVTTAYVDAVREYATQLAFATALPAQSLGFLRSDGASAGFTTTHTGYAQNEDKGADIASAATINLTTATGNLVHVTGTTTITAITIPSGALREVVFDGALTLTHNAVTLILPTGANITTAAGDTMTVRGDGAGNARVIKYQRATGQALVPTGLQLLAVLTPTAAASVDALTTFSSSYDAYVIEIDGVKPAADDTLIMRVAVAGVADSGATNYWNTNLSGNVTAGTSRFNLTNSAVLAAGKGLCANIRLNNVNDASGDIKTAWWSSTFQTTAAPRYDNYSQAGIHSPSNVVTGVSFLWLGGSTFAAAGEIRIYGLRN